MNEELKRLIELGDWVDISIYQKLTLDFIREFQDKVDWCWVSIYQKLTLDFIREFQDKVVWYNISQYQKLTLDFVKENINRLNYDWLVQNKHLDQEAC